MQFGHLCGDANILSNNFYIKAYLSERVGRWKRYLSGFLVFAWLSVSSSSHLCPWVRGWRYRAMLVWQQLELLGIRNYCIGDIFICKLSCNGFCQDLPCFVIHWKSVED